MKKKTKEIKAKHVLYTTPELYEFFDRGTKTLDIRPDHKIFDQFRVRDTMRVRFTTTHSGLLMKIIGIRRYQSLELLVEKENVSKIRPDFADLDTDSVLQRLPEILKYKNKNNDKVIVFELKKI